MGYEPPTNKDIKKSTAKLKATFNNYASLYLAPSRETIILICSTNLEATYGEKVREKSAWFSKVKPDAHRLDQIALISHTCRDLLPDLGSKDKDEADEAERALLGSAFYRHLRLIQSYLEHGYAVTSPKNCALHMSLVESFKIRDDYHHPKKMVVTELDPHTIATCCAAYRNYLTPQTTRDRYAYIKKDEEYIPKLDKIIKKANKDPRTALIQHQLDYIDYIQSMAKVLDESDQGVYGALPALLELLTRQAAELEHEDDYLTSREILEGIDSLKLSPLLKYQLENLISQDLVFFKNGEVLNEDGEREDFSNRMERWQRIKSKFILIGAYILTLSKCDESKPFLASTIRKALNVTSSNQIDEKTEELALKELDKFMGRPGDIKAKFEVWGGIKHMKRELLHLQKPAEARLITFS